jgi:hypothetical protein
MGLQGLERRYVDSVRAARLGQVAPVAATPVAAAAASRAMIRVHQRSADLLQVPCHTRQAAVPARDQAGVGPGRSADRLDSCRHRDRRVRPDLRATARRNQLLDIGMRTALPHAHLTRADRGRAGLGGVGPGCVGPVGVGHGLADPPADRHNCRRSRQKLPAPRKGRYAAVAGHAAGPSSARRRFAGQVAGPIHRIRQILHCQTILT